MHTQDAINRFIELRAKGWSFDRIAQEINVCKRTLLRWHQQFGARIENMRQIELEHLQERLLGSQAQQLEALISQYQRYNSELLTRDPGRVPQYMLFRIVSRLRDQVERRLITPNFLPEPDEPSQPESAPSPAASPQN